jgi:hypothetical protein
MAPIARAECELGSLRGVTQVFTLTSQEGSPTNFASSDAPQTPVFSALRALLEPAETCKQPAKTFLQIQADCQNLMHLSGWKAQAAQCHNTAIALDFKYIL